MLRKGARFPCWGERKNSARSALAAPPQAARSAAQRHKAARSAAPRRGQQPRLKGRIFKSGLLPKFHFHVIIAAT